MISNLAYDWIYGIWFVGNGNTGDWLARLVSNEGVWALHYRFRYYSQESEDPFDEKDIKHWWEVQGDKTEASRDKLLTATARLIPVVEAQYRSKADFVLLDCSPSDPKVLFELGSRPWAHPRLMKVEE